MTYTRPYLLEGLVSFVVANPVFLHERKRGISALRGQQLPLWSDTDDIERR